MKPGTSRSRRPGQILEDNHPTWARAVGSEARSARRLSGAGAAGRLRRRCLQSGMPWTLDSHRRRQQGREQLLGTRTAAARGSATLRQRRPSAKSTALPAPGPAAPTGQRCSCWRWAGNPVLAPRSRPMPMLLMSETAARSQTTGAGWTSGRGRRDRGSGFPGAAGWRTRSWRSCCGSARGQEQSRRLRLPLHRMREQGRALDQKPWMWFGDGDVEADGDGDAASVWVWEERRECAATGSAEKERHRREKRKY